MEWAVKYSPRNVKEWLSIFLPVHNAVIANTHRPPSCTSEFFEESVEEFLVAVEKIGTRMPNMILF